MKKCDAGGTGGVRIATPVTSVTGVAMTCFWGCGALSVGGVDPRPYAEQEVPCVSGGGVRAPLPTDRIVWANAQARRRSGVFGCIYSFSGQHSGSWGITMAAMI